MTMITLDKKVFWEGPKHRPTFERVISCNPVNGEITLETTPFKEIKTLQYHMPMDRLTSFEDGLDTPEKIVRYFYSIGLGGIIKDVPTALTNELENRGDQLAELLQLIEDIESGKHPVVANDVTGKDDEFNNDPEDGNLLRDLRGDKIIVDEDGELASVCGILITMEGRPNWDYIKRVISAGHDVFRVESDSFGWLSAGLRTSKGIIMFG